MDSVIGVVLAGGRSARMGQDKALLPFAGETLLSHTLKLMTPYCSKVWVNGDYPNFDCIPDQLTGHQGPLAGLHSVLSHLLPHVKGSLLVLPVDMPGLSAAPIELLLRHTLKQPNQSFAFNQSLFPLTLPLEQGTLELVSQLMESSSKRGRSIRALLEQLQAQLLSYEDSDELVNVNTPEQYQASLGKE